MYAIIENGEVKELIRELPSSTKNISNLKNLSKEELASMGYYNVVGTSPVLEEWQYYGEPTYTIKTDYVEENRPALDISLDEYKSKKIKGLSDKCHNDIVAEYSEQDQINMMREFARLQDNYNATQTIDTERVLELRTADKWIENRRAEYATQKGIIESLTTYQEIKDYVSTLYTNEEELGV